VRSEDIRVHKIVEYETNRIKNDCIDIDICKLVKIARPSDEFSIGPQSATMESDTYAIASLKQFFVIEHRKRILVAHGRYPTKLLIVRDQAQGNIRIMISKALQERDG
jgi:hypothetical protein